MGNIGNSLFLHALYIIVYLKYVTSKAGLSVVVVELSWGVDEAWVRTTCLRVSCVAAAPRPPNQSTTSIVDCPPPPPPPPPLPLLPSSPQSHLLLTTLYRNVRQRSRQPHRPLYSHLPRPGPPNESHSSASYFRSSSHHTISRHRSHSDKAFHRCAYIHQPLAYAGRRKHYAGTP